MPSMNECPLSDVALSILLTKSTPAIRLKSMEMHVSGSGTNSNDTLCEADLHLAKV